MDQPDSGHRWDFFLAHAGADIGPAELLYETLRPRATVFLDERSMLPGDPWTRILPAVLKSSRVIVVLVSPRTRDAWYADSEIRIALDLLRNHPDRYRVLALLLDQAEPIDRTALPYGLEQTVPLSWARCGSVERVAERLVEVLNADAARPRELHGGSVPASARVTLVDGVTGFVGETERGPTRPVLLTNWGEFTRWFGKGLGWKRTYLSLAVRGFFENGGERAYVARALSASATRAALRIVTASAGQQLVLTARDMGAYGNGLQVRIEPGSRTGIRVRIGDASAAVGAEAGAAAPAWPVSEDFDNLSPLPSGPNPLVDVVNRRSQLARAEWGDPLLAGAMPEAGQWAMSGGSDGHATMRDYLGDAEGPAREPTGLASLAGVDGIGIVCLPDVTHPRFTAVEQEALARALLAHCERERRFAILSTGAEYDPASAPHAPADTSAGAIYHPRVTVADIEAGTPADVPAVGHIAGAYARHDRELGVHVSPAGVPLQGLLPEYLDRYPACGIDAEYVDRAARRGVNALCREPGSAGRVVLAGAVTMAVDAEWQRIAVRRVFNYVERAIGAGTSWLAFAPADEATCTQLREEIEAFLETLWRAGVLAGATPQEAFFVRCDLRETVAEGVATHRLDCAIGVAFADPDLKLPRSVITHEWMSGSRSPGGSPP